MISRLVVLSFFMICPLAWAGGVLDRATLERYFDVSPKLEAEINRLPDLSEAHIQTLSLEDGGKQLIKYLSASKGYNGLDKIAKEGGFKSLQGYVTVTYTLIPSLYLVQKELYPDSPSVMEQRQTLERQKQELMKQGASRELVDRAMETFEAEIARQEEIERAAIGIDKADVKVVKENLDWVIDKMSTEDDQAASKDADKGGV